MASGILAGVNPLEYGDSLISGVVLTDMPEADITEAGIIAAITETQDMGAAASGARWISNLTEPPGYAESDTMVEPFSDLYGKSGDMVGETITRMVRNEATVSFGSLSLENLKLIRPDMAFEVVMGGAVAAATTRGTTNSALTITAKATGTGGNAVRYAHVVPATASAPLSVDVVGNDITVNVATGATAGTATSTASDVVAAVNASAAASVLVTASLPTTSDGTGVVSTSTIAALTGGAVGTTPVAVKAERTLETDVTQYKTLVIAYSTGDQLIGKAVVLKNAKSVTEEMEWSLDGDYTVQGVSATMRGHSTGADLDPLTGKTAPSAYILDFTRTAVPA